MYDGVLHHRKWRHGVTAVRFPSLLPGAHCRCQRWSVWTLELSVYWLRGCQSWSVLVGCLIILVAEKEVLFTTSSACLLKDLCLECVLVLKVLHPILSSEAYVQGWLLVQWEWQRLSAVPSKSGIISPLRLIWCDSVKIARVTKVLPKPHCVPLVLVIETSQPGTLLPVMVIIFSCSAASSGGLVPHLLLWNCPMSGDLTASAVWPVCLPSFGVRCCQQIKASDWFASLLRCYVPCRALCQPRGAAVC